MNPLDRWHGAIKDILERIDRGFVPQATEAKSKKPRRGFTKAPNNTKAVKAKKKVRRLIAKASRRRNR